MLLSLSLNWINGDIFKTNLINHVYVYNYFCCFIASLPPSQAKPMRIHHYDWITVDAQIRISRCFMKCIQRHRHINTIYTKRLPEAITYLQTYQSGINHSINTGEKWCVVLVDWRKDNQQMGIPFSSSSVTTFDIVNMRYIWGIEPHARTTIPCFRRKRYRPVSCVQGSQISGFDRSLSLNIRWDGKHCTSNEWVDGGYEYGYLKFSLFYWIEETADFDTSVTLNYSFCKYLSKYLLITATYNTDPSHTQNWIIHAFFRI